MPIIDFGGQALRESRDFLQKLDVTEEAILEYYSKLPIEGGTVDDEKIAFADVFGSKKLQEDDQASLQRMLDDSDPR